MWQLRIIKKRIPTEQKGLQLKIDVFEISKGGASVTAHFYAKESDMCIEVSTKHDFQFGRFIQEICQKQKSSISLIKLY